MRFFTKVLDDVAREIHDIRSQAASTALEDLSPPPAGTRRVIWFFGESDTPSPVIVPEETAVRLGELQSIAQFSHQKPGARSTNSVEAAIEIDRVMDPFLRAQYPDKFK